MTENVQQQQQRSMFDKLVDVLVMFINLSIGLPTFLYVVLCLNLLMMNAIGTLFLASSAHFIDYMPAASGLSSAARDYLIYEYHVPKSGYRMCESSYQSTSSMEIPLDVLEFVLQFESTKIHMITSMVHISVFGTAAVISDDAYAYLAQGLGQQMSLGWYYCFYMDATFEKLGTWMGFEHERLYIDNRTLRKPKKDEKDVIEMQVVACNSTTTASRRSASY
jgi:hypothetical protein